MGGGHASRRVCGNKKVAATGETAQVPSSNVHNSCGLGGCKEGDGGKSNQTKNGQENQAEEGTKRGWRRGGKQGFFSFPPGGPEARDKTIPERGDEGGELSTDFEGSKKPSPCTWGITCPGEFCVSLFKCLLIQGIVVV